MVIKVGGWPPASHPDSRDPACSTMGFARFTAHIRAAEPARSRPARSFCRFGPLWGLKSVIVARHRWWGTGGDHAPASAEHDPRRVRQGRRKSLLTQFVRRQTAKAT